MKEKYMELALKEANKAFKKKEIPIGAVIIKNGKVISKAHNLKEKSKISINHAEIIAIKKACRKLKNWRLSDCEIYITIEPCLMCYGAIKESRIKKIIYGAENENFGFTKKINIKNEKICIEKGILKEKCLLKIKKFFEKKRTKNFN